MINYNGELKATEDFQTVLTNRAFKYGDGLFETIKVRGGKIIFAEDHYFRLMASMRMLRMDITMNFSLEFFEDQILKLLSQLNLTDARVRFTVFREAEGFYLPTRNTSSFFVEATELNIPHKSSYEVDLFKDYYVYSGILSTLKTNNRILNVLASNYGAEQGLDNCLLLNESKHLVEAINGNLFVIKGDVIATPALSEGCIKGIVRKKLIELLKVHPKFSIEERAISPFELLKADELFISNSIIGIQPITKYRKREFETVKTQEIREGFEKLNSTT
ncbi:aminotransferase class IV [Flavobacteriaceae bacterium F08102]|nr:aminotransferase class IV [Flavobacteriaceae bacterium F08102]